jgi:RHS repeat-associated protein
MRLSYCSPRLCRSEVGEPRSRLGTIVYYRFSDLISSFDLGVEARSGSWPVVACSGYLLVVPHRSLGGRRFRKDFRLASRDSSVGTGTMKADMPTTTDSFYRARYYEPSTGRFLNEDPLSSVTSRYAYVSNGPTNWVDPSGMTKTNAQCWKILQEIKALAGLLAKEIAKYDPVLDGMGNWPMKGGGLTKPGGHYIEMGSYATGIVNKAAVYLKDCMNCDKSPSLSSAIWNTVKKFKSLPPPIITMAPKPPDIPDELINWYDPSPLEQFNKFMNQHYGQTAPQGSVIPIQVTNWIMEH